LSINCRNVSSLERIATLVRPIKHGTSKQIAKLAFVKGLTLPWLYKIAFDHDVRIAINLDFEPLSELTCVK
jgi:hypothetical protein